MGQKWVIAERSSPTGGNLHLSRQSQRPEEESAALQPGPERTCCGCKAQEETRFSGRIRDQNQDQDWVYKTKTGSDEEEVNCVYVPLFTVRRVSKFRDCFECLKKCIRYTFINQFKTGALVHLYKCFFFLLYFNKKKKKSFIHDQVLNLLPRYVKKNITGRFKAAYLLHTHLSCAVWHFHA